MDSGAKTTERMVIIVAILLGIGIVLVIGYSLFVRATRAEGELANKNELESSLGKPAAVDANISLTGESKNSSSFSYDGLIQRKQEEATSTNFEIVNETTPVDVPVETEEEALPPEDNTPVQTTPVATTTEVSSDDRPLTDEEIRAIRQLQLDDSPTADLQTTLEKDSDGQYKARY